MAVEAVVRYVKESFDPKKGGAVAGFSFPADFARGGGWTATKIAAAAPIIASQWLCVIP